ncbi:serine hydrolase domain-containing protein [Nonomuraea sp. NPDC050328]|uniref:serine hydrolase domain-containing protein n=1 Tax=Nonomuraea sp. NPDC050328 TaxID=3364361 RepID=UPI0037AF1EDD
MSTQSPRAAKALRRSAVAVLTAALVAGPAATGASAATPDRPELRTAMQAFIDAGFTGVQLRVRDEDGEWTSSAGVRKLGQAAKPPTNGSFWTGSVVKPFTATLVLQLAAEGKLRLDDPVADHLPGYGFDRRITVRMLLQHTSGLFNYTGEFTADGTLEPGIIANGDEWLPIRFRDYRPEELVRLALSKPARFEPGAGQSYSNTNYTVALLLVEQVTGRPYAEEMHRRILRPLRMTGTVVPGTRSQLPGPHAHGYYRYQDATGKWTTVDISRQNPSLLAGAGDLISTTRDLQTFFSALNSGRLLPAGLLAEMRQPYGPLKYGLGVFATDLGPGCGTVYEHKGSPPHGYGALMYSSPDGARTVTGSVTWVDEATRGPAKDFQKLVDNLVREVFCD